MREKNKKWGSEVQQRRQNTKKSLLTKAKT